MDSDAGKMPIRVLIVDDHPLIQTGLSQLLNKQQGLVCCGVAGTIGVARSLLSSSKPDLVTMDLGMPDGDAVHFIKELSADFPSVLILVISQCDETIYAERVLKAGARGYLTKERCTQDIVVAIRSILEGNIFVSQKVTAMALRQMAGRKNGTYKDSVELLSNRELEVLRMLGSGLGTRVVSAKLNLSIKTIETHRENIKHKLGIDDAASLIHFATGWVDSQSLNPPTAG